VHARPAVEDPLQHAKRVIVLGGAQTAGHDHHVGPADRLADAQLKIVRNVTGGEVQHHLEVGAKEFPAHVVRVLVLHAAVDQLVACRYDGDILHSRLPGVTSVRAPSRRAGEGRCA